MLSYYTKSELAQKIYRDLCEREAIILPYPHRGIAGLVEDVVYTTPDNPTEEQVHEAIEHWCSENPEPLDGTQVFLSKLSKNYHHAFLRTDYSWSYSDTWNPLMYVLEHLGDDATEDEMYEAILEWGKLHPDAQ